jgi:hypothetical protein
MPYYKGWNVKVYKDGTEIGFATSCTIDISQEVEAVYILGSRDIKDLVIGNREITASVEGFYISDEWLDLLKGTPSTFDLKAQVSSTLYILLKDCYLESESFDFSQDGFLRRSADIRAKDFKTYTIA